jgi:outer membrane protein assembly factor BamB
MSRYPTAQIVPLVTAALFWSAATMVFAQDKAGAKGAWPQFLGPDRNGISQETGLLETWPTDGPKQVWRIKGGVGMSGLVISRGKLITMLQDKTKQSVVALEALTGKQLWKTEIGPRYRNSQGAGPRATPTIVGDMVYTFSGEGILTALKFGDGSVVWQHNTLKVLGGKPASYGMACSPLVVDGRVIVTVGAPDATVVAYDRVTGKLVWKSGTDRAGYSSPAFLKIGGVQQLVVFTGQSLLGIGHKDGKSLWRYPYKTTFDCNIATPISYQDKVFISSGENHGCVLLRLKQVGGIFKVAEVWKSQGTTSVMRNGWQTSILWGGHLYGLDNVGPASLVTHLSCVDIATGRRLWQKKRFGNGNLIAADGKLIFTTMKGDLVFVRITPEGYKEIGRSKVIGKTRQGPALANGRLYLRDDSEIVCLDVRKKP